MERFVAPEHNAKLNSPRSLLEFALVLSKRYSHTFEQLPKIQSRSTYASPFLIALRRAHPNCSAHTRLPETPTLEKWQTEQTAEVLLCTSQQRKPSRSGKSGIWVSLTSHHSFSRNQLIVLAETSPIIIQRAPKFKTHVKINSESSGADPVRLIAELDLSKLGAIASAKRACGRLGQIYVMDVPDAQKSRMVLD